LPQRGSALRQQLGQILRPRIAEHTAVVHYSGTLLAPARGKIGNPAHRAPPVRSPGPHAQAPSSGKPTGPFARAPPPAAGYSGVCSLPVPPHIRHISTTRIQPITPSGSRFGRSGRHWPLPPQQRHGTPLCAHHSQSSTSHRARSVSTGFRLPPVVLFILASARPSQRVSSTAGADLGRRADLTRIPAPSNGSPAPAAPVRWSPR